MTAVRDDPRPQCKSTSEGLFPPSARERLDALVAFVRSERAYRLHMLQRHPERGDYWQGRVAEAETALYHIERLREEVG